MKTMSFCAGLGSGLALAILFAPRAGTKTPSLVRHKATKGLEYVKRQGDEIRDTAAEFLKGTADKVVRESEGVKAAVAAGKRAYEKVTG